MSQLGCRKAPGRFRLLSNDSVPRNEWVPRELILVKAFVQGVAYRFWILIMNWQHHSEVPAAFTREELVLMLPWRRFTLFRLQMVLHAKEQEFKRHNPIVPRLG